MDSKKFVEALWRIGYPKAASLNPDSFEWVFMNPSTRPFVNWLCTNVGEENVLTDDELEEYLQLEKENKILEGTLLDEALNLAADDGMPSTKPEEKVQQLKKALVQAKAQRETLQSRCSKLNVHQMALQGKESKMTEEEKQSQKSIQLSINACTEQNLKINETLQKLYKSVEQLGSLYQISSLEERRRAQRLEKDSHFLSHLDLQKFHDKEQKYSHDLTALTKKLFFEGMADMTGERDASTYELLNVSNSSESQLLVRGNEKKEAFRRNCDEFSRLQSIFPTSEGHRINAVINAKKALSAVNQAMAILHSLKSGDFPKSPSDISGEHHQVEKALEKTRNDASSLQQSIPDLVRELGSLQGNEILTGDYDLKLKRQEYFTQKQDKIIKHLLNQRSRSELLSMLYDLEIKCHQENHHLLSAVRQILDQHCQDFKQQMADLNDPDLNVKRFERSVVDTRDTSTFNLYQLLNVEGDEEKPLYLPKVKVVEKAQELSRCHAALRKEDRTLDEDYLKKVVQLEECLKQFQALLYGGSSTSSGHPVLTPPEVQSSIAELTTVLDGLFEEGETVMSDFSSKRQILKTNALHNKERQLFALFHNDPVRLKQIIAGMKEGLLAQTQGGR